MHAFDVEAVALDGEVFAVGAGHHFFFGVEFSAAVHECGACGTLDGEGEHHSDWD